MSRVLRHLLIALALLFTQQAAQLHALSHLRFELGARLLGVRHDVAEVELGQPGAGDRYEVGVGSEEDVDGAVVLRWTWPPLWDCPC